MFIWIYFQNKSFFFNYCKSIKVNKYMCRRLYNELCNYLFDKAMNCVTEHMPLQNEELFSQSRVSVSQCRGSAVFIRPFLSAEERCMRVIWMTMIQTDQICLFVFFYFKIDGYELMVKIIWFLRRWGPQGPIKQCADTRGLTRLPSTSHLPAQRHKEKRNQQPERAGERLCSG